jgi:hypothetical protein
MTSWLDSPRTETEKEAAEAGALTLFFSMLSTVKASIEAAEVTSVGVALVIID